MKLLSEIEADGARPSLDRRIGRRRNRTRETSLSNRDLAEALGRSPILAGLSEAEARAIIERCDQVTHPMGRVILRQGSSGSGLHLLAAGRVRIIDESDPGAPVSLAALGPGALFGERSLLLDSPVNATVRAASNVRLMMLSPESFRKLIARQPQIAESMTRAIARYEQFNFLRRIQAFQPLADADLYDLLDAADRLELPTGTPLVDPSSPDDGVWAIVEGGLRAEAQVVHDGPGAPNEVPPERRSAGQFRPGDLHGLRQLFDPSARRLDLTAQMPSEVLRWQADMFLDRLARAPDAMAALRKEAALEDRRLDTLLAPAALADTGTGSEDADLSGSVLQLRFRGRSVRTWSSPSPGEDGLAALKTAAALMDPRVPEALERKVAQGADVSTSLSMLAIEAEAAGFVSRSLRIDLDNLSEPLVPFLFHGPDGRVKTAIALDPERLHYADPATGEIMSVLRSEAQSWWKRQALTLSKVPDFAGIGQVRAGIVTRFLPMLRPHRRALVQIALLALLSLIIGLLLPLATATIIDHVLVFNDRSLLMLMLAAIIFAAMMSMASEAASSFLTLRIANMINGVLMARFFSHVLAVPLNRLGKWRSGDLAIRFEENEKVFQLATGILSTAVFDVLSVVVFGIVLFAIAPVLTAFAIAVSLVVCLILIVSSKRLRALEMMQFDASRDLQSHVIETFDGIESLKFASREDATIRDGVSLMNRSVAVGVADARYSFRLEILIGALGTFAGLAVLGVGGKMVLDGQMTAGSLIAVSGLMAGITGPIERIAGTYDEVQELRVSFERVNDILDLPREAGGDIPAPRLSGRIRFENVRFEYEPGKLVLSDINLEIEPGTKVAFVGPSGSGKSTLVRLVNRLLDPTEGRVSIDGLDISRIEPASLRRQIGVVEQVPHVFSGTIRENIAKAFPDMPLDQVARAARLSGAADFTERLPMGYGTRVGEGGRSLSGGQAQRVVIARAIAGDPRILILDEATSALDTESEQAVQRALDTVMAGRTVVSVAHRLSTIRNADKIVVLKDGRIIETGTHDALMETAGLYRQLVEAGDHQEEVT